MARKELGRVPDTSMRLAEQNIFLGKTADYRVGIEITIQGGIRNKYKKIGNMANKKPGRVPDTSMRLAECYIFYLVAVAEAQQEPAVSNLDIVAGGEVVRAVHLYRDERQPCVCVCVHVHI